ncbi:Uncharacterised protein [Bordetella pertussis]|nr:Uncharacterised protein [Bordetella pertussis]SUV85842.1 Uncharacterised protein [Bordetella pertussis]
MAIGKFQGAMMPTTPTGSRVTSTSMPGRVMGSFSPWMRKASPAKNLKMWPARVTSLTPSGRVLPSSRDSSRPSSSLRASNSVPTASSTSARRCPVLRAHAWAAALAAAIAMPAWAASAWA